MVFFNDYLNQQKSSNNLQGSIADQDRLIFLDVLRGVAIIMVVGVHANGYCLPLTASQDAIIKFLVFNISVPIFFLVDGFLFARQNHFKSSLLYLQYVKKSAERLLVPWFFFTLVYSALRYVFEMGGYLDEKLIVGQSMSVIFANYYGSLFAGQLYFLLSLFLLRLMVPLTVILCKIKKNYTILIFVAFVFWYHLISPYIKPSLDISGGNEPIIHALWGGQYYLSGICLYLFREQLNNRIGFLLSVFILFLVSTIGRLMIETPLLDEIVQWSYLFAAYFAVTLFPGYSVFANLLGKNTMGIYLLHVPVAMKVVSIVVNSLVRAPLLSYLFITFLTLLLSVFLTIFVKKLPHGKIIFGEFNTKTN